MNSAKQGQLLAFVDASLYNRDEVVRALHLSSGDHSSASLILKAYARWGSGCLSRINGDFGFAILDHAKGEVFLACDHIGARPLYWTVRGDQVFVSSCLQGFSEARVGPLALSLEQIARFIHAPTAPPLGTFFQGVRAVGAGHCIRIRNGSVVRTRWWNPNDLPERSVISSKAAEEEFRHLTRRAIEARLPSGIAVGTHFSGGIDSTLVTSLASSALQARGQTPVAAYAWSPPISQRDPDMGDGDERRLISTECRALGIPVHFGGATAETFDSLIQQPFEFQGVANLMDEIPVIAQAQSDGVKIMLSGWGGDEGFSSHGTGHLAWLLRRGKIAELLRVARRFGGGLRRPHLMASFLWRNSVVPLFPDHLWRRFSPFLDLYADGAFPSEEMKQIYARLEPSKSLRIVADADAYMKTALLNGHIGERMATWAAWGKPAGLEYRYPLTDRYLLEFVLSLPREVRFGDGTSRYLVRRAFGDILPKGINKQDLANERLRNNNRIAYWRILSSRVKAGGFDQDCPWLDMPALRSAMVEGPRGDKGERISTFARIIVALRVYEMYRRHSAVTNST